MSGFDHSGGELVCDGASLGAIAEAAGTPCYVYSAAVVRDRYQAIDGAFGGYPHRLHYALKANSTLALARLLRELGSGADANSIWEIEVAKRAGFALSDIVFTGVGKSASELECAVDLGLKAIIVESSGELDRIEQLAGRRGNPARVAVRVNPDIDARSHPHISTGLRVNKFGIPVDLIGDVLGSFRKRPLLTLVAVHVHIGSQITALEPLQRAARVVAGLARDMEGRGTPLEYVDVGGGLGISYDGAPVVSPAEYVGAVLEDIRPTGLPVVSEPGRAIVGPAGVLVARVVDVKPRSAETRFAVIDAGMTELMRPALYGAYHRISPLRPRAGAPTMYEIVGPVCESSDVVGRDREMPPLEVGDLVAIHDTGAYGSVMASNYNRRPLPVEVLVDRGAWSVIRRRQTVDDLMMLEQ
jgi:diaminopimelate decarboxylase